MSPLTLCSVIACFMEPLHLPSEDSVVDTVNSNIGPNQVIYLLNNQSLVSIQPLIVRLNRPLILGTSANSWNNIDADLWYPPHILNAFVVVLCEQLRMCSQLTEEHTKRHIFNPRQKVLVLLVRQEEGTGSEMQETLRDAFERFWRINLWNVVVIRFSIGKQLQSFTFNPYDESFLINLTGRSSGDPAAGDVELYPNKVKDMQGRPFRMSLFESPPYLVNLRKSVGGRAGAGDEEWFGYDGGMLDAIVKHFNATLKLVVPVNNDPGYEIYSNATTILLKPGATQDVVEGRSDMVINTRPFTPSYLIEYLYPHYFNPVSIILPKSQRISWATGLMRVFHLDVLVPLGITILIVLWLNYRLHRRQTNDAPLLEILAYFLQNSYCPTLSYCSHHRFLLVTWSIFTIVIMSVITGTMYSHVVVAPYEKDIDSVNQLMTTKYRIPIIRERYSLFEIYKKKDSQNGDDTGMLSPKYWRLMPKFLVYESLKDIFELIDRNEPFAFMQTNGHCEYFAAKKRAKDGGPVYHLMKEIVVPDNAVQIVQWGSPHLDELNKLLLWFKEAGLDQYSRMRLNLKFAAKPVVADEVNGLSFESVSHAFSLFKFGVVTCMLTFLGELLWWQIARSRWWTGN